MAGYKDNEVANAFARIANNLQQKTTVTPYGQSNYTKATGQPNYQYQNDYSGATDLHNRYSAQFNENGFTEAAVNVPRRIAGAFGELAEQAVGSTVAGVAALNRQGVDDAAQTAFIKLQDQKRNAEYQQELDQLRTNPQAALNSGKYLDMRDVQERMTFLGKRLQDNQLSQDEYKLLYNEDGSETYAKQRLNWSDHVAGFGEYLAGNRQKGEAGYLNARNWYDHSAEKAYQGHKAWNGTSDKENQKLVRDAQDAYDQGDYLTWAKNQGKAFLNSAKDTAKGLAANPAYLIEETAAMAPYINPYTIAPALAIDAARIQNQSHDQFTDRELRTPTAGESLGILGMTAAYTAANYAEAVVAKGAIKGAGVGKSLGLASKVGTAAEKSAARMAFSRLAGIAAVEGGTEAIQQQIESKWGSLDPTLDAQGMGEAAVMGAAIGGALGGPAAVGQAVVGTGLQAKAKAISKATEEAIKTNPELDKNTSTQELANPESPKFNAEAATVRMTQEAAKAVEEIKEPEQAQAKIEEIKVNYQEMVDKLSASQETMELVVDLLDNQTEYDEYKAQVESELAAATQAGDQAAIQENQVELDRLNAVYTARDQLMSSMDEAAIRKKYEDDDKHLNAAKDALAKSKVLKDTSDVNPTAIPSTILSAPSTFSTEELTAAANATTYSSADKEVLRALTEARQEYDLSQTIDKVSKDILDGSAQSKAVMSYIDDAGDAVVRGDTNAQRLALRGITRFANSHGLKAEAVQQAYEMATSIGGTVQVIRNEQGKWVINEGEPLTGKAKTKNAALDVTYAPGQKNDSTNIVAAIQQEAKLIAKVKATVDTILAQTDRADIQPTADRMQQAMDSLNPQNDLKTAQEQAEQGQTQQRQQVQSKAKQTPKNTPVNPDENIWEGLDDSKTTVQTVSKPAAKTTQSKSTKDSSTNVEAKSGNQPSQHKKEETKIILSGKSAYLAKDQIKADKATKFIGKGSKGSSTEQYAKDFRSKANTGDYSKDDVVFISVNGNRAGRVKPDFAEIDKAISAGATLITDKVSDRNRTFNIGEREVATYLTSKGYVENNGNGIWNKESQQSDSIYGFKPETVYTAKAVLDKLFSNAPSQGYKKLAEIFLEYNPSTKIIFTNDASKLKDKDLAKNVASVDARAFYGKNTIVVSNLEKLVEQYPGVTAEDILLHEIGHMASGHVISTKVMVDEPEDKYVPIKAEILAIQEDIKNFLLANADIDPHVRERLSYMVDNAAEIFTVGLTEKPVIKQLKQISIGNTTVYDKLKGLFSKFFGLTGEAQTMFDRILEISDTVAELQQPRTQQTKTEVIEASPEPKVEEVVNDLEYSTSDLEITDQELSDLFSDMDTTKEYDSTFGEISEINAELEAQRKIEREKPLAERNLVKDAVTVKPTIVGTRRIAYTTEFAGKKLPEIEAVLLKEAADKLGTELEPQQVEAVKELARMFFLFGKQNTGVLLNGYAESVPDFKNFAKYLVTETKTQGKHEVGYLDPHVMDAITVSAFSWITENGSTLSSKEDVAKKLFFTDAFKIPTHVYNGMKDVGTYKNNAAQSMGTKAVQVLGYQFASDVAASRKEKLAVALGHIATHMLIRDEYLQEVVLGTNLIESYTQAIVAANEQAEIDYEGSREIPKRLTFVKLPTNNKFEPIKNSAKVLSAVRGSKSVISKVFGLPQWNTPIQINKPKELVTQKTIDAVGTQVPEFQVKALEHAHQLKWNVSTGMHSVHTALQAYPELLGRMYGKVTGDALLAKQAMKREGIESNNQAIDRDIRAYEEAVDLLNTTKHGLARDFYLQQEVWVQQRSGMVNAVNPVASKLHRGMVSLKEHIVDVSIDKASIVAAINGDTSLFINENGVTQLGEFIQAVALNSEDLEPGNVKTTADKTQILNYAPQYLEWMLKGDGVPVLASMSKVLNGKDFTEKDVQRIADTVDKMGMNAMSLKALVNMTRFRDAFQAGETKFTSDISIEIDGVTNGPFLTQVMLNTLNPALAGAGGLYKESDGITTVPQHKDTGADDMYEHNAKILDRVLTDVAKNTERKDAEKIKAVVTELKILHPKFSERKGAKTLTTVINFAAGGRSTAQGVAGDVLDSVIGLLEKVEPNSVEHKTVIQSLNRLLKLSGFKGDLVSLETNPKDLVFTYEQEKAFLTGLQSTLKTIVDEFTVQAYPEYVQARDEKTALANFGYELFNPIYEDAIQVALEDVEDKSVEGISKQQLDQLHIELRPVMPSYPTAMGLKSSNTEESAIPMFKSFKRLNKDPHNMNDLYIFGSRKTQTRNLNPNGTVNNAAPKESATSHIEQGTKSVGIEAPGVRNTPMAIHSQDAYIAHANLGKFATMNIHDALNAKMGQGRELGKSLNQVTLDSLVNTDLNVNFALGALKPLQRYAIDENLTESNKETLTKSLDGLAEKLGVNASFSDVVLKLLNSAYDRDINKLISLSDYKYLNQYGIEGGEYQFTEGDYKQITDRIAQLETQRKEKISELLGQAALVDKVLGLEAQGVAEESKPIEKQVQERIQSNVDMHTADFYLNNVEGEVNKNILFSALAYDTNQARSSGNLGTLLSGQMFNLVKKALPDQLEIKIANASSPKAIEQFRKGRYGWINTNENGKPVIYLLPQDGKFDPAIVLHELLHAATHTALQNPKSKAAVQELEALRSQFKKFLSNQGKLEGDNAYAVSSLDEFIATVFSEPEVARLINQMHVKAKRTWGLGAFLQSIANLFNNFFGKPSAKLAKGEVTGLEALMIHTVALTKNYDSTADYAGLIQPASTELGAPRKHATDKVKRMNANEILQNLNGTGTNFDSNLQSVLNSFALPILDRMDNALLSSIGLSSDPESVWADAIAHNQTTTTDEAVLHGFSFSERERYVTELLYAATQGANDDRNLSLSYAELNKTFTQARSQIKPQAFHEGDWSTATPQEQQAAQAKWNYLFKITANGDHLARFTSMVLGNESVFNTVNVRPEKDQSKPNNMYEQLVQFINQALENIGLMFVGAKANQKLGERTQSVVKNLAKVDLKHRNFITNKIEEQLAKADNYVDEKIKAGRNKLAEKIDDSKLSDSKNAYVGLAADITAEAARGNLMNRLDNGKELFMSRTGKLGFWGELVNEIAENSPFKDVIEKLMRHVKLQSQTKEQLKEQTIKNILSTFKNGGKDLTRPQKEALSYVMKADVQSLLGFMSVQEIQNAYNTPTFLRAKIKTIETQLKGLDVNAHVLIGRSEDLARYMITGLGAKNNDLAKNATLIAMHAGTKHKIPQDKVNTQVVELVDQLVSLYAIQYTPAKEKELIKEVMAEEVSGDINGIDTLLKFHAGLASEARDELFKENPLSVTKGFVPEITNPHHEIKFATTEEEALKLKNQYFREVKSLEPNTLVQGQTVRMFLSEDAGQTRLVSGALELVSKNPKGTPVKVAVQQILPSIQTKQSAYKDTAYDPFKDAEASALIPQYDLEGNISGFSYEMSGASRDVLLQRNNDFSELIGLYSATNFNKMTVPETNKLVVDALVQEYNTNHDKNPRKYLEVSHKSSDPELRKMWDLLPKETRDYIQSQMGERKLYVPKDVLLPVFGFQKYSVMQGFDKERSDQNLYEKLYTTVFKILFQSNARTYGSRFERGMQEAVAVSKNIIVIRNVRTLVMNILSNTFLLQAHGASLTDIMKDSIVAVRAGLQHRKDSALLTAKRQMLYTGVGNKAELEQEVLRLEQSIARNPLSEFINEGMLPSIVDDVAMNADDDYGFKSALERKFEKQLNKIPKPLRRTAEYMMVSPNTPLYEFLNNTTQLSDFTAKYVMYKYYTNTAKDKLSHDKAIKMASDNFINYDMPTSKGMQYLNDMGIVMFTKYNLRIQKALFRLLERKPARALLQALVMHHGTDIPFGIDPIVWNQMGFPLRDGALILPDALGEPIPVQLLGSVL